MDTPTIASIIPSGHSIGSVAITQLLNTFRNTVLENEYIPHRPTDKQSKFLMSGNESEILFGGAAGGGKALSLDTEIATTDGWVTMGNIQTGQTVFDPDGNQCTVQGTSPVMHKRACYRVTFSDGQSIVADGDHLWVTQTVKDRDACHRRTKEFRDKRKASRPRRGKGKRPDLVITNEQKKHKLLIPPTGTAKTTVTISETIKDGVRLNHSIPVAKPLQTDRSSLPIDPYVLGTWLGDGTASSGSFTSADAEVVNEIEKAGFICRKQKDIYGYGILGLFRLLREGSLLKNKHIPECYFRASVDQRLSLLQGLMDTDGTADSRGQVVFTGTNKRLVYGAVELLWSLGIKATVREGRATLYGKDCGPKYNIKFLTSFKVFRLQRKLDRQKRCGFRGTHRQRYIVSVEPVDSVPVRCIAVDSPSHCFLASRAMIPTHNSDALLMAALQYVDVPGYHALLLRRTYADLALPGALMDRAHEWLQPTDAQWIDKEKTWKFPKDASLTFGYLDNENAKYRYQGADFQFVGFDELTQFTKTQYEYLFSRMRRLEGVNIPLRMRTASNPGGVGHLWVKKRFINSDTATGKFIPSLMDENPHIDQFEYERSLSHLTADVRNQLRYGIWDVEPPHALWRSAWIEDARLLKIPTDVTTARTVVAIDPSATEGGDEAGIIVACSDTQNPANYYILEDASIQGTPSCWAKAALTASYKFNADRIYYEANQGGDMVKTTLQNIDPNCRPKAVWASKGKTVRAEPISVFAEYGQVHHVGTFPKLEAELTTWVQGMPSPNRLDAYVYAITALTKTGKNMQSFDRAAIGF